jgi:hypothetical protein
MGFFSDLSHSVRVGWLLRKAPKWGKGVDYYRLTSKGRRYLERRGFNAVLEAFRLPEAIRLSASRAELQRQGWYSVKHVGWVEAELVNAGYYEQAIFFRNKMNGTFFRLTSAGKSWAVKTLRSRLEAEFRRDSRRLRADKTKCLKEKLGDPGQLVEAWRVNRIGSCIISLT